MPPALCAVNVSGVAVSGVAVSGVAVSGVAVWFVFAGRVFFGAGGNRSSLCGRLEPGLDIGHPLFAV